MTGHEYRAMTKHLPDGLHPDAVTHEVIGQRFADHVLADGGAFRTAVGPTRTSPGERHDTARPECSDIG